MDLRELLQTSKISGILFLVALFFACKSQNTASTKNSDGWIPMFNGRDINDWTTKIHHYEVGDNHGDTFRAEDGLIKVRYDQYEGDFNDRYGHLYYNKPYSSFHLSMEYRFVGELHPGAPSVKSRLK